MESTNQPVGFFDEVTLGGSHLRNRLAMAPMTRSRALPGGVASPSAVTYYRQRATAGLIITEATQVSAQGIGYLGTPGSYTPEQTAGWKAVVEAVHAEGSTIFMQLFHVGRISHPYFQENQQPPVGASDVPAKGDTFILDENYQLTSVPLGQPRALETVEVVNVVNQFANAAKHALEAGFDGIEVHGANGYLLEQFLNPVVNQRTDQFGGSIENRARLLLSVTEAIIKVFGPDRVGVRLSPFGTNSDMPLYPETEETYFYLADHLRALGVAYVHLFDQQGLGTGRVTNEFLRTFRQHFGGALILNGNLNPDSAATLLRDGLADVIAFGRPYIANPDLVARLKAHAPLATPDPSTFYAGGDKGYIDYPLMNAAQPA